MRKRYASENDESVVDQRPERRKQKETARRQHRGNYSPDVEQDLGREQNAGEVNAKIKLLWLEVVEHEPRDLRCKDFRQDDANPQNQGHHGNDYGEGFLGIVLSFFRQESRVDGNEGDGNG